MTDTLEKIKKQISSSPVLLYMKGSPQFPECGFSAKVSKILISLRVDFNYVNILENPDIRSTLPAYAQWPTFPQLWVNGTLIGGCDIVTEMHSLGELDELLKQSDLHYNNAIHNLA